MSELPNIIARFEQLPWLSAGAGARQKVVEAHGQRVRQLELEETFVEPDWCEKPHVGYVITGALELAFPGGAERFASGDAFVLAGGSAGRHRARAIGGVVRLLLVEPITPSGTA